MSAAAHTPGPWTAAPFSSVVGCPITAQPDKTKNTILVAGTRSAVAEDPAEFRAEVEANARLIAAAPDMLQFVRLQLAWLQHIKPQVTARESVMLGFDQAILAARRLVAKVETTDETLACGCAILDGNFHQSPKCTEVHS